jgi:hypothetical protein
MMTHYRRGRQRSRSEQEILDTTEQQFNRDRVQYWSEIITIPHPELSADDFTTLTYSFDYLYDKWNTMLHRAQAFAFFFYIHRPNPIKMRIDNWHEVIMRIKFFIRKTLEKGEPDSYAMSVLSCYELEENVDEGGATLAWGGPRNPVLQLPVHARRAQLPRYDIRDNITPENRVKLNELRQHFSSSRK